MHKPLPHRYKAMLRIQSFRKPTSPHGQQRQNSYLKANHRQITKKNRFNRQKRTTSIYLHIPYGWCSIYTLMGRGGHSNATAIKLSVMQSSRAESSRVSTRAAMKYAVDFIVCLRCALWSVHVGWYKHLGPYLHLPHSVQCETIVYGRKYRGGWPLSSLEGKSAGFSGRFFFAPVVHCWWVSC